MIKQCVRITQSMTQVVYACLILNIIKKGEIIIIRMPIVVVINYESLKALSFRIELSLKWQEKTIQIKNRISSIGRLKK